MMHANYYGVFLGQWGFLSTWYRSHRNKRDIPISSGTASVYFVSLTPRSVSKVEIKSPSWSRNFPAVFTRKKLFATIVSSQVTNQSDAYKTSKPTIIFHLIVSPVTVNCGVEWSGVTCIVLTVVWLHHPWRRLDAALFQFLRKRSLIVRCGVKWRNLLVFCANMRCKNNTINSWFEKHWMTFTALLYTATDFVYSLTLHAPQVLNSWFVVIGDYQHINLHYSQCKQAVFSLLQWSPSVSVEVRPKLPFK